MKTPTVKVSVKRKGSTGSYRIEKLVGGAEVSAVVTDGSSKTGTNIFRVGDSLSHHTLNGLCADRSYEVTVTA